MIKKYLEIFKKYFYLFVLIDVGLLFVCSILTTKFGFNEYPFFGIALCLAFVCLVMMIGHKLIGVPNPLRFEDKKRRERRKKYEDERIESALELSALFLPLSALCLTVGVILLLV